jgi:hypothetical protein
MNEQYKKVLRTLGKLASAGATDEELGVYLRSQGLSIGDISTLVEGPTVTGQAKEFLKGIPSGAVGLLETAATGAASILPDEAEKAVRGKVGEIAAAARKPFEAAPGYEDTIPRKFGEATGSVIPFLPLGAAGIVGRAGAFGLGAGAGAGEARVRAEQEGGMEQRGSATALGAVVGLTEALPVFAFLDRLSTPIKDGIFSYVRRAAVAGGQEGAQEAAASVAQDLIAKGLYKPEQVIGEQAFEEGAYGAGVGALVQGILDMSLGRRAKAPPPAAEPPAGGLPPGAKQTSLFTKEEAPIALAPDESAFAQREEQMMDDARRQQALVDADSLRNEFDTLQRENERLKTAFDAAATDEEKADIKEQADRIAPALTSLEKQIKKVESKLPEEERGRAQAAPEQMGLDFDMPRMDRRRTPEGVVLGETDTTTPTALTPEQTTFFEEGKIQGIRDRMAAGEMVTPAEMEQVRLAGVAKAQALEATPTPDLFTPSERTEGPPPFALQRTDIEQPSAAPRETITVTPEGEAIIGQPEVEERRVVEDDFKSMGIGATNKKLREKLLGKDLADPEQRAQVREALEDYANDPNRSEKLRTGVESFLSQPMFMEQLPLDLRERAEDVGKPAKRKPKEPVDESGAPSVPPSTPPGGTGGTPRTTPPVKARVGEPSGRPGAADAGKEAERASLDNFAGDIYVDPKNKKLKKRLESYSKEQQDYINSKVAELQGYEKRGAAFMKGMDEKTSQKPEMSSAKDTDPEEAAFVESNLRGKNLFQVAKWLEQNAPNPDQRLIAGRVAARIKDLEAQGLKFSFEIKNIGDRVYAGLMSARGLTLATFGGNKAGTVEVFLNGADVTGRIGTNYRTALHELVHAVTTGAIRLGNYKLAKGTPIGDTVTDLYKVSSAIIDHFNQRVRTVPKEQLTDFEQAVYNKRINAFRDADEILTWALTNPDAQQYLDTIPYKNTKQSVWGKFVETIRKFLNLPASKDSALSEVLRVADEIFNADLQGLSDIAAGTKTSLEQTGLTAEGQEASRLFEQIKGISNPKPKAADETLLKRLKGAFTSKDAISWETRLRRQVVDKEAPVSEQIKAKFNNAVKDELSGTVRPDLLLAQKQDIANFGDKVVEVGGIRIGKDGLVEMFERKDAQGKPINMDRVLEIINVDLAKKLGSADLAVDVAHNALIGFRAGEINKFNERMEKLAAAAEAKGNKLAAQKLRDQIINTRVSKEQIDAANEAMRKFPEIREAYDVFTEFKNGLVDFLESSGRINSETAKNWRENVGYVPWTRVEEKTNDFELDASPTRGAYINLSKEPHLDREGSSKEINNIFDNMVGTAFFLTKMGVENYANLSTLKVLPDVKELTTPDEIREAQKKHADRLMFSYEDGERKAYLLSNPFQLSAFMTIPAVKNGLVMGTFSNAAKLIRTTITHMPAFAISQLIQDGTYRAMLLSGVKNPWALPPKVFGNFFKLVFKDGTESSNELARMGVTGTYDGMPENAIRKVKERLGLEHRNAFKRAWDGLEKFSLSADLAVRSAIFEQTLKETGDRGLAFYRAKEYINFKRQGVSPVINTLRQSIPFMNAYMQGMDILYRTMTGKGVAAGERKEAMKLFYYTGAQIAVLNLLYTMAVSGDDEYEGLDDFVKNRNYIIPGTGVKIPVAPEVGFFFKVLPEQLYRYINDEGTLNPQDAKALRERLTSALGDAMGGVGYLPAAIKPALEVATNYSFFLESPIVGAGLRNLDPRLQFTESTSELSKILGDIANISPAKIDYFLRAYTGMAGAMALDLSDAALNPDRMDKPIYKTPQLSTFMYDPTGRGLKSNFYKFREDVTEVRDTINMLSREGRMDELEKYLTPEKIQVYAMKGVVSKIENKLADLRKYRKMVASDTDMSPQERRAVTDELLQIERRIVQAYDIPQLRKMAGY